MQAILSVFVIKITNDVSSSSYQNDMLGTHKYIGMLEEQFRHFNNLTANQSANVPGKIIGT